MNGEGHGILVVVKTELCWWHRTVGGPGLHSWLDVRPELQARVRDDDPALSPVPAWRRPERRVGCNRPTQAAGGKGSPPTPVHSEHCPARIMMARPGYPDSFQQRFSNCWW